jgi:DNA adenine methylase
MPYPGGKSLNGLFQRIINEIPPHSVYIEPFLGDGGVLRRKKPAKQSVGIDIERRVFERWAEHNVQGLQLHCCDGIEWLKHHFGLYCVTASAEVKDFSSSEVLEPGIQDILVYADPPYQRDARSSNRKLYSHELSLPRHQELLNVLKQLKCNVMISSYESSDYRKALEGWRCIEIPSVNRAGHATVELLWMNYPSPEELHDYSYLGSDKRQRERIRRRTRNLIRGLGRLPALERRAIFSAITSK